MPDREIVIKELEALQKAMSDNQCYSCTHEFVDVVNLFGSNIVADALALLKEQDDKPALDEFGRCFLNALKRQLDMKLQIIEMLITPEFAEKIVELMGTVFDC